MFTGQYWYMDDPSTTSVTEGFGLMYFNARWYDPRWDDFPLRFTSQLCFAAETLKCNMSLEFLY
jgi:hypothetical protein